MHVLLDKYIELRDVYARLFSYRGWVRALAFGFAFLMCALFINYYAGLYATMRAGPSVPDTLLDVIPRIDTSFVHESTVDIRIVCMLVLPFIFPQTLPLLFNGLALVVLVRSLFVNMTQLGLYHDAGLITNSFVTFGGDLFFSGHVAMPLLLSFVYWKLPWVRYSLIFAAILLGASSLMGHYHYSIDVFAAPFFAYSLYKLSVALMPRDVVALNQQYGL